jgi:hypothetical protein
MARGRQGKRGDDVLLKSAEMLGWAIGGLEREISQTRERLAALTAQAAKLRARLGPRGARTANAAPASAAPTFAEPAATEGSPKRRRRKMSPEARQRISEMMTKRWAEHRKNR